MITDGVLAVFGLGGGAEAAGVGTATQTAGCRLPAVAGLFYPEEEKSLSNTLARLLEIAPARSIPNLKALICPHAGYVYSGPTAAHSYKLLAGREFETVVVLGPSHYADFTGVSVPAAGVYRTPLGDVPISDKAATLARRSPFVSEPRCFVQRPGWWRRSPKPAPADDEETPETWEHSVEVQVPFLQATLKHFKILPLLFGDVNPEDAARGLAEIIDDKTLVVVSTDLSHYHPYEDARRRDGECVEAICALDVERMKAQEACGKTPVLTLLHLALQKGWEPQLLDYRNSGDTTGDRSGVVGYGAIAFSAPAREQAAPALSEDEKKLLLGLARRSLEAAVSGGGPTEVAPESLPEAIKRPGACFVTLKKKGELRGCIGNISSQDPLYQAVAQNARNAALRDSRFAPVEAGELADIKIEISVLTEPQPLTFDSPEQLLSRLQPGMDGVSLKIGFRNATYLPQVWEQIPDKVEFLNRLSLKAGCAPPAWRGSGVSVSTYRVEAFGEKD